MTSWVWLHGFASGPASGKARYIGAQLAARGAALAIPDLNAPSFRELTVTRMLAQVDQLVKNPDDDGRVVLFGSSLGGFVAATWAARNPGRCAALVLLAPAFDLGPRWRAQMGETEVARWRSLGAFPFDHYATGRIESLNYAFLEDALSYDSFPLSAAPTLLLQGEQDEVVSPQLARDFTRLLEAAGTAVRLVMLPDGHELNADLPRLWREMEPQLARFL